MLMPSVDSVEEVTALRQRLIDRGYEPVAVATGEKRPVELGWQHKLPSDSAHVGALNTGLRCGAIIAVDIDIDDPKELDDAVAAVEAVALPTPLIRERASAPRLVLVYRAGEVMKKRILPFGSGKIEFLATGQQFVSHGTHPCGDTFLWRDMAPEDIDASELPVLTSAHIDEIARRLGVEPEPPVPPEPTSPVTVTTSHDGAGGRERAWAKAALDQLTGEVAATPEGSRSDTLNKGAYRLGGMVVRGWRRKRGPPSGLRRHCLAPTNARIGRPAASEREENASAPVVRDRKMKARAKSRGRLKLPDLVPGAWHGEITGTCSLNVSQIVQDGPPRQCVEFSYVILPALLTMPNNGFTWPSVIMIMAPTPMKPAWGDAGNLFSNDGLFSLSVALHVTRGQFSDAVRLLEAKRLKRIHLELETERDGSWPIHSWGMEASLG